MDSEIVNLFRNSKEKWQLHANFEDHTGHSAYCIQKVFTYFHQTLHDIVFCRKGVEHNLEHISSIAFYCRTHDFQMVSCEIRLEIGMCPITIAVHCVRG